MDIAEEASEKLSVAIPTRRAGVLLSDSMDSPDPVNLRDSTVIPALSQVSSPRQSVSVSVQPENDSHGTSIFGDSVKVGRDNWRSRLKHVSNSWFYTVSSLLFVLFSLYGDDIRMAATAKGADRAFDWSIVVTMVYFAGDWLRLLLSRNEYRWSFVCFLDLISTVTLVADISFLWSEATSEQVTKRYMHRVGDTARVTSLTFRSLKFLRAVRLARAFRASGSKSPFLSLKSDSALQEEVQKLNQRRNFERRMRIMQNGGGLKGRGSTEQTRRTRKSSVQPEEVAKTQLEIKKKRTFDRLYHENKSKVQQVDTGYWEVPMESLVSKEITHRSLRLVFSLVVLSACVLPFFSTDSFKHSKTDYVYGLELLEEMYGTADFVPMMQHYIDSHQRVDNLATLVLLVFDGQVAWHSDFDYHQLRVVETVEYSTTHFRAVYDMRTNTKILADLEMADISFICVLLLASALLVTNDFSSTVLLGLERMVRLIRKIARDPMLLLSSDNEVGKDPEQGCCCHYGTSMHYGEYEITLLEQALKKIGVMLALGLGTAGCETITSNIKTAGRLDPLIPGRKVLAVFCFVSIRNFDTLAELLGERLLIFINKVAAIVHSNTEKYQGAINRNLGESFFLVWKFQDDDSMVAGTKVMVNPYSMTVRLRAALALVAVIRSLMKVAKSGNMANFLNKAGMYAVGSLLSRQLSAGLHVGWAFEGPVGSPFKIDATYLSPHVNKTARIESATRQYDVHILASDDFVQRLDDEIKPFLRHIDTVLLRGTSDSVMLYAFDMSLQGLGLTRHIITKAAVEQQKEKVKEAFEFNYFNVHELFTQSEKIKRLRELFSEEFFATHARATQLYIDGEWQKARELYQDCLRMNPADGPSMNILAYMEKYQFQHPLHWVGVRTLASK